MVILITFITRNGDTDERVSPVLFSLRFMMMYLGPSNKSEIFWFFVKKLFDMNSEVISARRRLFLFVLSFSMVGNPS